MADIPADLRKLYKKGRLIPFIGAGVSMSVEWKEKGKHYRGPSWAALVNQAAKELGYDDPDLLRVRGTDLQILEYFRIKNQNQFAKLTNWLFKNMQPSDDVIKNALIHSQLSLMDKCPIIYTTNFDNFLERSFKLHGRECSSIVHEAHMRTQENQCEIIKFHGDLDNPTQMVLSESDYEERLSFQTAMDFRFRADVLGRAVLFIGYSFRDWNVSYLFRLLHDNFKDLPNCSTGRRAYITVPNPSDFEIELFKARHMEVIPIEGKDQTQEIANLLQAIRE